MTDPDLSRLVPAVVDLAVEAGRRVLEIYDSGEELGITSKGDSSPLTAADLASQSCLVEGLAALTPAIPILSEESAAAPFDERRRWGTYWLIDPLDGTKEFIRRNGEFTVNVALVRGHEAVLGVVCAPVLDTCYFAAALFGAHKRIGGATPSQIRARHEARRPPVVVGSRSHRTPELETYLSRIGEHELRSIGSSLKLCLVAEGAADLYPRLGPTSEWDTAAAQCVVEVAGGSVTDLRGRRLAYNAKDSILNPSFLVFGDASRAWHRHADGIAG